MTKMNPEEDELEEEDTLPPRQYTTLTPEQELQYRLELQAYQKQQELLLKKDIKKITQGKKKDYNPFHYACYIVGAIALFLFLIIASMGYPLLALLYVAFYLFLSLFALSIIWILCYFGLAIIGYILVILWVIYIIFMLIYTIINYNKVKNNLKQENQNSD